jgi:rhodanese-related sulfurtransferase
MRAAAALALLLAAASARGAGAPAAPPSIFDAVIGENGAKTPEVSTRELQKLVSEGRAVLLDARPFAEFAVGHIPGAINVAAKPGASMSLYVSDVAEIGRVLGGRKDTTLILYCNGPFCGKSKRLADELLAAGYARVLRYQLGIPVWRALGGVTVIEPEGLARILAEDRTAVVVDARDSVAFAAGSVRGARNLPRGRVLEGKDVGEVKRAKDDGRLPMEDHNTRLIVISDRVEDAEFVAKALAREAFHNVSSFHGGVEAALGAAP